MIPPKSTAVIASVEEPGVEVIDGEMKKLDGEATRRTVAEVMAELEAAEEAATPLRAKRAGWCARSARPS